MPKRFMDKPSVTGPILKPRTGVLIRTQVRSGYGHDKVRGDFDREFPVQGWLKGAYSLKNSIEKGPI